MAKPRLIILIRHAQSEGNKNREIHQTLPDHRVKLTQDGWQQAYEAGRRLRTMLRADDTLHFFTSPYRRTRETTEGILATLTSDESEPSPFKRNNIKVYEEPRLREQDFGNFQPCSAEMERMWQERADYGHFFYRIPNGESAADAYDRISGFNESLWRQFGEDDFASVCVLVTHGLMSRVFLMKWYHFSVEYFEDLRNVNHCEFLIMRKQDSGKYNLENKLRTWSELKRERALQAAKDKGEAKEKGDSGTSKDSSNKLGDKAHSYAVSSPVEPRRRWGGCPNGCNHDKTFRIRQTLVDLVKSDSTISSHTTPSGISLSNGTHNTHTSEHGTSTTPPVSNNNPPPPPCFSGNGNTGSLLSRRPTVKQLQSVNADAEEPEEAGPQIDVTKARDEVVSSPDGTSSFISVEDRPRGHHNTPGSGAADHHHHHYHHSSLLHVGRDFGGTYSGHNSVVASDADSSEDDDSHRRRLAAHRLKVMTPSTSSSTSTSTSISGTPGGPSLTATNSEGGGSSTAPTRHGHQRGHSRMARGARANRLGDAPHSSDGEHEADAEPEEEPEEEPDADADADADELSRAEKEEKSVQGSVY